MGRPNGRKSFDGFVLLEHWPRHQYRASEGSGPGKLREPTHRTFGGKPEHEYVRDFSTGNLWDMKRFHGTFQILQPVAGESVSPSDSLAISMLTLNGCSWISQNTSTLAGLTTGFCWGSPMSGSADFTSTKSVCNDGPSESCGGRLMARRLSGYPSPPGPWHPVAFHC